MSTCRQCGRAIRQHSSGSHLHTTRCLACLTTRTSMSARGNCCSSNNGPFIPTPFCCRHSHIKLVYTHYQSLTTSLISTITGPLTLITVILQFRLLNIYNIYVKKTVQFIIITILTWCKVRAWLQIKHCTNHNNKIPTLPLHSQ